MLEVLLRQNISTKKKGVVRYVDEAFVYAVYLL